MPKTTFIWDFDGTLVQSYGVIEEVLESLYHHYNLPFDLASVSTYIIDTSVGQLLKDISAEHGLDSEELLAFFQREQEARDHLITLMPYAREVLEWAKHQGIQQMIYTHKGATTIAVLKRLGIDGYFTEVITSANGFKRKPHPEAVTYLLDKYQLDKARTYYIGDRKLDVDVAEHAGIWSINLGQKVSTINRYITNLSEIMDMIFL